MSLYHDSFSIQRSLDIQTIASLSAIIVSVALSLTIFRKKYSLIGFGIIWFYTAHLLESTIIPLEMVFEHRNYLASLGIIITLISTTILIVNNVQVKWFSPILFLSISSILAFNTHARAFVWSSNELLITSQYGSNPNSPRVLSETAIMALRKGDFNFARNIIRKSQQLTPDDPGTYLIEVVSYCNSEKIPEHVVNKAILSLSNGRLTAHAIAVLSQLLELQINKKCTTLPKNQILRMTSAAIKNNRVHSKQLPPVALVLHARALRFSDHWTEALNFYIEALKLTKSASISTRRAIIDDIIPPLLERESESKVSEIMSLLSKMEPSISNGISANN
jgi:hypothetical protein